MTNVYTQLEKKFYVVQTGDTIAEVAKQHGCSVDQIYQFNSALEDQVKDNMQKGGYSLNSGQVIYIGTCTQSSDLTAKHGLPASADIPEAAPAPDSPNSIKPRYGSAENVGRKVVYKSENYPAHDFTITEYSPKDDMYQLRFDSHDPWPVEMLRTYLEIEEVVTRTFTSRPILQPIFISVPANAVTFVD